MNNKNDNFHHGQLLSHRGIENDSEDYYCNDEECTMPLLRFIIAVVQSDEAFNLRVKGSVSIRYSLASIKSDYSESICAADSPMTVVYVMGEERPTRVPAANESPTTDPCQPIARIQPVALFSKLTEDLHTRSR